MKDLCSGKMTYALTLLTVVFTAHFVFSSSSAPDVNPNILKAANFAIASYNRKSNYPYAYKVVDVLSQSVALYPPTGVKYSMELQVTETNCRNDGNVNLQDCSLRSNAQTMTCSFVVLAVPGENTMPEHLLSDHCT
ncbi:cystatin isoform X2 [Hoplias malabaricus]|uniref:cystatin isoform X2 n=1 Tax=Hoplias malabaricus TaxID=27720 RepID=UPI003462751D